MTNTFVFRPIESHKQNQNPLHGALLWMMISFVLSIWFILRAYYGVIKWKRFIFNIMSEALWARKPVSLWFLRRLCLAIGTPTSGEEPSAIDRRGRQRSEIHCCDVRILLSLLYQWQQVHDLPMNTHTHTQETTALNFVQRSTKMMEPC